MNYIKQLLAALILLAACADVDDDSFTPDGGTDGGVELGVTKQASCVSPCRPVPHKIFLTTDYFSSNWEGSGNVAGTINNGTYLSGLAGGNQMLYSIGRVQIKRVGLFNSCTTDGVNGWCDGQVFACPHYSLIKVSESSHTMYCGDKYGMFPYGPVDCGGSGSSPYKANWSWHTGSHPLVNQWNESAPGYMWMSGFINGEVYPVPGTGKVTYACNYQPTGGVFGIDKQ